MKAHLPVAPGFPSGSRIFTPPTALDDRRTRPDALGFAAVVGQTKEARRVSLQFAGLRDAEPTYPGDARSRNPLQPNEQTKHDNPGGDEGGGNPFGWQSANEIRQSIGSQWREGGAGHAIQLCD